MERIEQVFHIPRPLRAVYDQWTQFEEFPRFARDLTEVKQLDHTHLRARAWLGEVGETQWEFEITDQIADLLISWRSVTGTRMAGTVRFEAGEQDGRPGTRVRVILAWDAPGTWQPLVEARLQEAMERFAQFIELRGEPTGAWRGEIDQGVSQGQPL